MGRSPLKAEGGKLLAKLKDLAPEFKDWVKRGLYKKVSIALYPDLGLRHVGFLGATPPAIKGLKQASFSEKAAWIIVEDIEMADLTQREKDKQAQEGRSKKYNIAIKDGGNLTKPSEWDTVPDEEFLDPVNYRYPCPNADQTRAAAAYWGKPDNQAQYSSEERAIISKRLDAREKHFKIGQHADMVENADLRSLQGDINKKGGKKMDLRKFFSDLSALITGAEKELVPDDPARRFTEADLQAKVKEAKDFAFADTQKKVEVEVKAKEEAEKKLKEIEIKGRKDAIASFCEGLCKEGKLTPALRKIIEPVMIAVSEIPDQIEFSEGVKKTRLEGIKDFLTELSKVITFRELVPREGPGSGGNAGDKLSALIKKKMEKNKDLSYGAAFAEVQKENPELATDLLEEIRHKK